MIQIFARSLEFKDATFLQRPCQGHDRKFKEADAALVPALSRV